MINADQVEDLARIMRTTEELEADSGQFVFGPGEVQVVLAGSNKAVGTLLFTSDGIQFITI
jgi:hypothetical protein